MFVYEMFFVYDRNRTTMTGIRYTDEKIVLPEKFDPLAALDRVEKLYEFTSKVVQKLPTDNLVTVRYLYKIYLDLSSLIYPVATD